MNATIPFRFENRIRHMEEAGPPTCDSLFSANSMERPMARTPKSRDTATLFPVFRCPFSMLADDEITKFTQRMQFYLFANVKMIEIRENTFGFEFENLPNENLRLNTSSRLMNTKFAELLLVTNRYGDWRPIRMKCQQ